MSKEMLSRIFDPFFTTKFTGRGLGLPAMLGNLKRHSAGLSVESRLNEGTTFHLYFPESIKEFTASRPEEEKEGTDRRGTILFADDEPLMREMITEALVPLGYTVLLAKDGVEAVELYRAHQDILLTILDVTMPRMGGMEAFQAIRHINPKAQVVLGSGYFEPDVYNEGQMVPDAFLSKPFRIKELCDTIDRLCYVVKVSPE
jgi:CheY-like chemotaxis protein